MKSTHWSDSITSWLFVLFLNVVTTLLAVSCNGCSTTFAIILTCLTNIKILTVATITINFKVIFNDYNMSVAMTITHFNVIRLLTKWLNPVSNDKCYAMSVAIASIITQQLQDQESFSYNRNKVGVSLNDGSSFKC
jgi:hypothetical protein